MSTQQPVKTIADIARLAGVSKSTVSRALSDSSLISEKTKAHIRAIAEANDFAIHQGARSLSLQKTQTIAVMIPIDPRIGRFITDPFNIELLGAVANALAEHDQDLLVAQVRRDDRRTVGRYLNSKRADGMIMFACDIRPEEISRLIRQQSPFIVWGPPAPDQSYCTVGSNDQQGGYLATQHLLETGRRRIAFIGGRPGTPEGLLRYQGYEQALHEAGLEVEPDLIEFGDYSSQTGYEKMTRLLNRRPDIDGVFALSDVIALGVMQALRGQQRKIPADVAVVGYDGAPMSAHCTPPLTTIRQDLVTAGQLLVGNLLNYIDHGEVINQIIPVQLVKRQSTTG